MARREEAVHATLSRRTYNAAWMCIRGAGAVQPVEATPLTHQRPSDRMRGTFHARDSNERKRKLPHAAQVLYNLGHQCMEEGDVPLGEDYYRRAVEVHPEYVQASAQAPNTRFRPPPATAHSATLKERGYEAGRVKEMGGALGVGRLALA
jgi:hypothetical protein